MYHWSGFDSDEDSRPRIAMAPDWESADGRSSGRATAGAAAAPPGSDGGVATAEPSEGTTRAD
jgi:hypothetical protein